MTKEDKKFIPDRQTFEDLESVKDFVTLEVEICNQALAEQQQNQLDNTAKKRIQERINLATTTLQFINIAIENDRKGYSAQRDNIFTNNLQPALNANYKIGNETVRASNWQDTILSPQGFHKFYNEGTITTNNIIHYAQHEHLNDYFTSLRDNAKKLANARNEERYQPLQDIMDTIIIMLSKAASMHMPTVMIDAAIKVLGSIGGHLADIIKEDYTAMRSPDQLKEMQKYWEQEIKRLETEPLDKHLISTLTQQFISRFNEISDLLDLPRSDKFATNEQFIDALETSITKYLQNDQIINQRENKQPNIDIETLNKLYENAATEIQSYKQLVNTNTRYLIENAQEKLANVTQQIKNLEKKSPRKSSMEMREELKAQRDQTHLEKVRKQNEQRSKFHTK